jgi:hypothetical protein
VQQQQEELKIELTALLIALSDYKWISHTYINEAKNAVLPLDAKKIVFCLEQLEKEFVTGDDEYYNHASDPNFIKLGDTLKKTKDYLTECNKQDKEIEPLIQFLTALNAWLENEKKDPADMFSSKYQQEYQNWGEWN